MKIHRRFREELSERDVVVVVVGSSIEVCGKSLRESWRFSVVRVGDSEDERSELVRFVWDETESLYTARPLTSREAWSSARRDFCPRIARN